LRDVPGRLAHGQAGAFVTSRQEVARHCQASRSSSAYARIYMRTYTYVKGAGQSRFCLATALFNDRAAKERAARRRPKSYAEEAEH
jgi:hypothetical protein